MTYIPTRSGWLYLAVLIDLATRGIVGWATSASMATALPLAALHQAVARRQPGPGLIHHTDRGSQPNTRAATIATRSRIIRWCKA